MMKSCTMNFSMSFSFMLNDATDEPPLRMI